MIDILATLYPYTKTLHIISVISWMAAMLYLPRLFVNHAEHAPIGSPQSEMLKGMEERLYRIILTPAMSATWLFGILLALTPGIVDWSSIYPYIKGAAVLVLSGMHGWLKKRMVDFAEDRNEISARSWRMINEVPTVLMILIVAMVVIRPF